MYSIRCGVSCFMWWHRKSSASALKLWIALQYRTHLTGLFIRCQSFSLETSASGLFGGHSHQAVLLASAFLFTADVVVVLSLLRATSLSLRLRARVSIKFVQLSPLKRLVCFFSRTTRRGSGLECLSAEVDDVCELESARFKLKIRWPLTVEIFTQLFVSVFLCTDSFMYSRVLLTQPANVIE